jgi:endoglucanase
MESRRMTFREFAAHRFGIVLLCVLFACDSSMAGPARSASVDDAAAFAAVHRMGRGVNILGYDGVWEGGENAPFRVRDFTLIREAGFGHVRINFFGFRYMDGEDRIDPAVLARLDKVVDLATRNGLTPVLDQHDNQLCQTTPERCKAKLAAFWRQIAARYAGKQPRLIYELLNEPGGQMSSAVWNDTLRAALEAIRVEDPERVVIVAALNAGGAHDIDKLELPSSDRRLVVTVHYYEPMAFTHQGAPWSPILAVLHDVDWGSETSKAKVVDDLAAARNWVSKQGRPMYLGEFGVYDKAPAAARAAWAQYVARTAERFGWSWAYWQFDHDFALFDSNAHSWNRPLLDALMR